MKNTKLFSLGVVAMAALMTISGCGGGNKSSATGKEDSDHSVVMVTDVSGVDDKSFNQSAWEGLQKWGKEQKFKRGIGGCDFIALSYSQLRGHGWDRFPAVRALSVIKKAKHQRRIPRS